MQFHHDLIELPRLERIDSPAGRRYRTPSGVLYPSVTTVIGHCSDKSGLEEWKKRVGEEEAAKVSARAARRGTEVHRLCEDLVLNRPIDLRREMPINAQMFGQIRRELEADMTDVRGSELFLYSDRLKVAGACDLIASYRNKKSIIDFKTSTSMKSWEWIHGYFIQTSLYSFMFWERTGIYHGQLVVVIAVESETNAQVFIESASDWINKAQDMCKRYHSEVNLAG